MTIQPPWTKRIINLILIGETGVGKTAMLNLLANVCAGIPVEEFEEKNELNNEAGGSKSGSQTNEPRFYSITCANGHKVNILDTPGLADTRGIDKDNEHKESIANAIKKNFDVVDAVIILANGTLARLGAATEYTLTTISGMFPNSIVDNIAFVFTMVSTPALFNFDRTSLPQELKKSRVWSIDNPFAQWLTYRKLLEQDPPANVDDLEETVESTRRGYAKALKMLSQVFQYLDQCKVQPTHSIFELYLMSTDIEARISNVIARMTQTEDKRTSFKSLQANYKDQGHKMLMEKYERIINTPFYQHQDTGAEHNTLCVAGNCYSNCHERCTVGFTMDRETLARMCASFEETPGVALLKRRCKDCGHLAEDHQHYRTKWVKTIKTDTIIDPDVKKRYDAAKTESENIADLMKTAQTEIEQLERDIVEFEKELTDLCEKYNKLSLSGSFIGYIASAISLLKIREKTLIQDGKDPEAADRMAQRIERLEKKRKVLEGAEKPRGRKV
ncbi:hypothetical protein J3R30DRAFT_217471 [Lentinula aciculospora]|uniref:AIG1-type G domain-containing protein n=1 Tax=Lentinula aciculospora TaxID=153920 RepID=A0A9W9A982_9AGAR|nr:hypothetical protein J3R30DRAFT_217471 [Lentinula aciculospora]